MKRIFYFIILFFACLDINAQKIESNDKDININIDNLIIPDGYLFDMRDILLAPPTLVIPSFDIKSYNMEKKMNESFYLRNKVKYGQALFTPFSNNFYFGRFGSDIILNSSTYQFKNGIKITSYGEYDSQGYKRYNPSALPWQKNNFYGAFEMKTRNGNFGIRVEVQKGRENPF